jgi:hypothetical protein
MLACLYRQSNCDLSSENFGSSKLMEPFVVVDLLTSSFAWSLTPTIAIVSFSHE